ncbi:MAG: hypothetical protein ACHBN1_21575 [Heteroscytonema crispum UTEX LB 1556]
MLRRLIRWLKRFFQSLFDANQTPVKSGGVVEKQPPPPLTDTDLEFLFNELLEGVHQARGQAWAQKWLHNIEHRVPTERWVEWLRGFGERLLASTSPNNELAVRMVQLGELGVGEVGDVAYDIGMQMLTRNEGEPVWEYEGPDAQQKPLPTQEPPELEGGKEEEVVQVAEENGLEQLPEGEYQTITLDELLVMLQQDESLREQIAEQMGIESNDPQMIIQVLLNQFQAQAASQSTTDGGEN